MKCMFLVILVMSGVCCGAGVENVVPLKAEPFELSEVRLLEGPFKHAQVLPDEPMALCLAYWGGDAGGACVRYPR